jgi:hypothetical protein
LFPSAITIPPLNGEKIAAVGQLNWAVEALALLENPPGLPAMPLPPMVVVMAEDSSMCRMRLLKLSATIIAPEMGTTETPDG